MRKKLCALLLCLSCLLPSALAMEGIDVSVYQGEIDFEAVREDGVEVVYIRSGFGSGGVDPNFEQNRRGAAGAGLDYGFYHYMEAATPQEAQEEARHFAALIAGTGYTCRPVLDFEIDQSLSDAQASAVVAAFLEELEALTGVKPMLYADRYEAGRLGQTLGRYPLWIAQWGVEEPDLSGTAWTGWTGWQYTDKGTVAGIRGDVDRDRFTQGILIQEESPYFTYTIRWGDTLWALSIRYGTTVEELARLNGIPDPDLIYAGETLKIPEGGAGTYTVRPGDTLWGIARTYGVTVDQLVQWNQIPNPDLIYPGQVLRVR